MSAAHTLLGGTRTIVTELLRTTRGAHKVMILSLKTEPEDTTTESICSYYNMCFHPRLWMAFGPWHLLTLPLYELAGFLWCICLRFTGTRIFMPQDPVYTGFFASVAAKLTRSRLVLFDYGFLLNLWGTDAQNKITFTNPYQRGRMTRLYVKLMRTFVRCSLSACDRFFIYSDEMEEFAHSAGLRPEKVVRFLFPIDTDRFKPVGNDERRQLKRSLGINSDRLTVTFLGRLSRDKGLPTILNALDILAARGKPKFRFVFAGDGPMRAQLLKATGRYPQGYVTCIGPASNVDKVFQILAASDVFVYPIPISNGYAMAFLEAMATGLPGIITDVGPTKEVLNDSSAIVIPREDPISLANAIDLLCSDNGLRARISNNAPTVVRRFSVVDYRNTILRTLDSVSPERG